MRLRSVLAAFALAAGLIIGNPGVANAVPCNGSAIHYGYHGSIDYTGYVFFHYGYHTRYYGGTCGFGGDWHGDPHRHSR